MKNIPLILETPTFENDEIWRAEIGVLNRLSGVADNDNDEDEDSEGEDLWTKWTEDVRGKKKRVKVGGKDKSEVKIKDEEEEDLDEE